MVEASIKTGTTTLGIVCKDGIILAADKRATGGGMPLRVMNKDVVKVLPIAENMAVTIAGNVSDIQMVIKLIKAEIMIKKMRSMKELTVKEVANLLGTILYQNIRNFSTIIAVTAFLLGGRDRAGYHLYELTPDGCVMEIKDYATDGSGGEIAMAVLDSTYQKTITVNEGVKLAIKCIDASIQRDTGSGEGADVYSITKDGIQLVLQKKITTTLQTA
ncbi:MAG TPA: proteasome subunit beta [Candidatus Nanoarchaeia archaeon]|nr:proteasome subunit beta [Candidatus Nanoarchaeia archaeon]